MPEEDGRKGCLSGNGETRTLEGHRSVGEGLQRL